MKKGNENKQTRTEASISRHIERIRSKALQNRSSDKKVKPKPLQKCSSDRKVKLKPVAPKILEDITNKGAINRTRSDTTLEPAPKEMVREAAAIQQHVERISTPSETGSLELGLNQSFSLRFLQPMGRFMRTLRARPQNSAQMLEKSEVVVNDTRIRISVERHTQRIRGRGENLDVCVRKRPKETVVTGEVV
ncbi:hypothetical protein BSKO_13180 [Bryopsis sp. KO-2023]|nr:hypothetical protein BSKO_13180 [Bryopsis sp. KO-2023]